MSGASTIILELPGGDGCADQYLRKHHSRSVQPMAAVFSALHYLAPHFFFIHLSPSLPGVGLSFL